MADPKDGSVIFLAGTTGTGKTTLVRNMLSDLQALPKFINDIDGEYRDFYNLPYQEDKAKFLNSVYKKQGSAIVFEEAGIFFEHKNMESKINEILICARRRKNFVIFNFHAMRQLPINMLIYCNFIIIKKTVFDSIDRFKSDYPEIVENYNIVNSSNDIYETRIINVRKMLKLPEIPT